MSETATKTKTTATTSKSKVKSLNKSALYAEIAEATGLSRKQVKEVFDALPDVIRREVGRKGPGVFTLPGLVKIASVHKEATKAGKRPNPFKPGEMMDVKAKPARTVLKVRPLKVLKDMV